MEKIYWQHTSVKTGLQNFDPAIFTFTTPVEVYKDTIKELIDANGRWTTRKIAITTRRRLYLKGRDMDFWCSHEKKFVSSHWRLWFASETSIKKFIFWNASLPRMRNELSITMSYITLPAIFSRSGTLWLLFTLVSSNFLDHKTFTSNREVKNHLDQFFAIKERKIYESMLQLEKWQKILDQNGPYLYNLVNYLFTTWKKYICVSHLWAFLTEWLDFATETKLS